MDKYVKLADLRKKINYILREYISSPYTKRIIKEAINSLPYTVKGELECTLEAKGTSAAKVIPVSKVVEILQDIGGTDAKDEWSKGYDAAIAEAIRRIEQEVEDDE